MAPYVAFLIAILFLLHAGCGVETTEKCAKPTGTFVVSWFEQSGSCGKVDNTEIYLSPGDSFYNGCEVHSSEEAADGCSSRADVTCSGTRAAGRCTIESVDRMTCVLTVTKADCESTYHVVYGRAK
jgi:hypothetical protein